MKLLFVLSLVTYHTVGEPIRLTDRNGYSLFDNELGTNVDPVEFIRGYGYPAETHKVITNDGYILSMHRIPNGRSSNSAKSRIMNFPVFLHHGLFSCSIDFIATGPKRGLAFILADLGFDVWMGNARGNTYSRAHTTLSPEDLKFWNYTWHDSAIYDLPAEIDFICNLTKKKKVIYMGFSMGTTMFFVLTSTLLKYNEKIEASFLMAPVAYMENSRSPILQIVARFLPTIEYMYPNWKYRDFLPESPVFKLIEKLFCTMFNVRPDLCMHIIFLIVGDDPEEYDKKLLNKYLDYFPAGYSTKGVFHFTQLELSGKFEQFDYGTAGNIVRYGNPTPPEYKLENIKVPVFLYYGNNDFLSTPSNVEKLAYRLRSLRSKYLIKYKKFSHLDFVLGENAKTLLYDRIIKDLKNFLLK